MTEEERKVIRKLELCDFSAMHAFYLEETAARKNRTKEEKEVLFIFLFLLRTPHHIFCSVHHIIFFCSVHHVIFLDPYTTSFFGSVHHIIFLAPYTTSYFLLRAPLHIFCFVHHIMAAKSLNLANLVRCTLEISAAH